MSITMLSKQNRRELVMAQKIGASKLFSNKKSMQAQGGL